VRSDDLAAAVGEQAGRAGDHPALVWRGATLGYRSLWEGMQHHAARLQAAGASAGDRVAVWLENRPETVMAALGAAAIGAIFVPVAPALKPRQVAHILADSGACILLSSAARLDSLPAALRGGLTTFTVEQPPAQAVPTPVRPTIDDDPAAILYTSGSTGLPKGVLLPHRSLLQGAFAMASLLGLGPADRVLAALPLSFDAGFNQVLTCLVSGATAVLHNYLHPSETIRLCAEAGVTGITGVPPLWIDLAGMEWPEAVRQRVRYFANTGGRMPQATLARLRTLLPAARPFLMYGLTEAFRSTCLPPEEVDRRPDSVGRPLPNARISVRRPSGELCEPGEVGEIVHVGACTALGYWHNPDATAARFREVDAPLGGLARRERQVWSGDLGWLDEDGYLYFSSRNDAMIKVSGYRVSPTEVEEAALATGLVREAVVLGVSDAGRDGQRIVLIATPTDGVDRFEAALLQALRGLVPRYMLPSRVVALETLPRSPNGKFDRVACLALLDAPAQAGPA
jgi:acyl-CoA ligase (AMP-forming) (exosortase A-associated)